MIRTLAISLAAGLALGLALPAAAAGNAGESFPVNHEDSIAVHILNGRNGQPLGHLHLILIAGYNQQDMRDQFWREEVISDAHGQVRLSNQMENLPWLQVWVGKKKLCQAKPRTASFSVDLIRRDGLSAPNHCGMATVEDAPGVFAVFVKGSRSASKHKRGQPDGSAAAPALRPSNPRGLPLSATTWGTSWMALCNPFASSREPRSPRLRIHNLDGSKLEPVEVEGCAGRAEAMAKFLLFCILLVLCRPLALVALVLYPLVWLLLLPLRVVGIAVGGALALVSAIIFLPARVIRAI